MKAIIIESYDDPHISDENIKILEQQGVVVEDWDLMVFIPQDECVPTEVDEEVYDTERNYYYYKTTEKLRPKGYILTSVIDGVNDNSEWHENINFQGETWVLGIKTH